MSVVLKHPPSLVGAFYDDEEGVLTRTVDWDTATPINSVDEVDVDHDFGSAIAKRGIKRKSLQIAPEYELPKQQSMLLLRELRQPFIVADDHRLPEIRRPQELLVRVQAIGLNPIDWKSV